MPEQPRWGLGIALVCAFGGCANIAPGAGPDANNGDDDASASANPDRATNGTGIYQTDISSCPFGADVYTPYGPGHSPSGTVAELPWRGTPTTYPNGVEDFSGYTNMPVTVECGNDKSRRSYVDVTAGCLNAVSLGGTLTRGQVVATSDGYFRAVALGYTADEPTNPIKWTDQSVEYRFYYTAQVGTNGNPGFKAFARYRTEDDLYVASWRTDGVAQIQRKHCGVYTPLLILPTFGAPSTHTWHTIRFDAIGDTLELYLDQKKVISTTDKVFSWGTAGMRIDSMDGAYIDDWHVSAPQTALATGT